jgi:P-type E1-E2 ATPase
LATPTVVLVASGVAALRGILVRDAAALEAMGAVRRVVWDKTGTLTTGAPTVQEIIPMGEWNSASVLRLAAAAEQLSPHPISKAIVLKARRDGIELPEPTAFRSIPGAGVTAMIDGSEVIVGGAPYLRSSGIPIENAHSAKPEADRDESKLSAYVVVDGKLAATIHLTDMLRPSARLAVERLARIGVQSDLLTGDEQVSPSLRRLGIEQVGPAWIWESLYIEELRRRSAVAMVGGVNDAAASRRPTWASPSPAARMSRPTRRTFISSAQPRTWSPTRSNWLAPACGSSARTSSGRSSTIPL